MDIQREPKTPNSSVVTYIDIVILNSSYSEMRGLLEAVNCHAAAVGMRIYASKTKVMSALIPGEQRSMFVTNGQGTEEIRSRIILARYAFSRLQSCLW